MLKETCERENVGKFKKNNCNSGGDDVIMRVSQD